MKMQTMVRMSDASEDTENTEDMQTQITITAQTHLKKVQRTHLMQRIHLQTVTVLLTAVVPDLLL